MIADSIAFKRFAAAEKEGLSHQLLIEAELLSFK
jgi:hypothetical protein